MKSFAVCSLPFLLSALLPVSLFAQDNQTEHLVVTATGYQQTELEAPSSISVITREDIEQRAYRDLTDALKNVPGVTVTSGGSRQDISIRGMPADYTAILVNGRKQSGRETQVSSSGGFEQDWLPSIEMIDRIEVIRGPMSTLYGSDAIGGVINIITRQEFATWQGSLRVETVLQEDADYGNFYQGQLSLAGPLYQDKLSGAISGLYQEQQEDDILYANGSKRLDNVRTSLYYQATEADRLTFDATFHDQTRKNSADKSRTRDSETNNDRVSFGLAHQGRYLDWQGDSYLTYEQIENRGRELKVENYQAHSQWSVASLNHYLTLGSTLEYQALDNNEYLFSNGQWSVFIEDEWRLNDDWTLTLGMRYDDNQQFDGHLSPRLYSVYHLAPQWTLKSGISTGYRAPSLTEMEADWVQESCNGRCDVYGNSDLTPEQSINSEMGLYYHDNSSLNANITVFYNDFNDKIDTEDLEENCTETYCDSRYNNIDQAFAYGVETSLSSELSQQIKINLSYTYTHSEQLSGEDRGQPLTQMPEHLVSLNGQWQLSDQVGYWLSANYRGKDNNTITTNSRNNLAPSITVFDSGAHWQVTPSLKAMAAVYNIFDKETTYQEYGYVDYGRRYWLAMHVNF
ncbi:MULTISPECIES: TonB-dependent receptor domain-containing protein [unclassified Vibrio]|uniref:TonB-dependent receptor n=1 Tax=Vibrio sp. HB236076 TaxID=3232307 RepID=A0AB39HEU4_9VIBR|nr:TonB-dependent receptor [Vibrio sp. HB161653]MDP5254441.1 TonB-dependent receptor [Vibrio sp. HB161653]